MRSFVLGIDLAETEIRFGMVDEENLLRSFETALVGKLFNRAHTPLDNLTKLIDDYIVRNKATPSAICIGFPSTLDRSRHRVQSTPNLPGFSDMDIVNLLERGLRVAPIYIDRDAVMLYYHDRFYYQLPTDSIIVSCYVGSGMGNVISIQGRILYGHNGSAAELGHVPIYGMHHLCACGNEGCIESLISWSRLAEIARKYYNDQPFRNIFIEYGDAAELHDFVEAIAVAVAIETNLLDPEFIIVGGRIVHLPGFPRDDLKKRILAHARKPFPAKNLKLLYSTASPENGVKGAGLYGFERLKRDGHR